MRERFPLPEKKEKMESRGGRTTRNFVSLSLSFRPAAAPQPLHFEDAEASGTERGDKVSLAMGLATAASFTQPHFHL